MLPPNARRVAATVLARVLQDRAFAAASLDAELERAMQLEPRDRALATELVYGTLRLFFWLEDRLDRHAKHPMESQEPIVRAHLAIAAYQVLALSRIPAFAAVSEAIDNIRDARGAKVAGFANAILRKVAAEPKPSADELASGALQSIDLALRNSIERAIGLEGMRGLIGADQTPASCIRVEVATERGTWLERFREARPNGTFEEGKASPHAILVRGAGKLVDLPGYAEGAFTLQEEGSQVIALALGAKSTDVVLDACAGRGNKTGLLARVAHATDAADVHPKKLDRLVQELARIGQKPRRTLAVDWARGVGDAEPASYDRVLVDAPCSGTGTLRRRPELALRRVTADVVELAALQTSILERASTLVKPGGRIVYAVCSILREEAEDVIARVPSLEAVPFDASIAEGETTFRLLPHLHGTDGYFLASLRRRQE